MPEIASYAFLAGTARLPSHSNLRCFLALDHRAHELDSEWLLMYNDLIRDIFGRYFLLQHISENTFDARSQSAHSDGIVKRVQARL